MWVAAIEARAKRYAIAAIDAAPDLDIVDECSIPRYGKAVTFDVPFSSDRSIGKVLKDYEHLFRSVPGGTTLAYHHIPTTGNPVKVPPWRTPDHYKQEVKQQICDTLDQGIIEESCSPWYSACSFCEKEVR